MEASQAHPIEVPQANEPASLTMLVDALSLIATDSALAQLNETSISDNNGQRIEL